MKSLKRNLLALAIIGAPFAAQAELKPIDDAQMGSITGQAGVTIELETKVNIGEFRYTDEGSLAIKDISRAALPLETATTCSISKNSESFCSNSSVTWPWLTHSLRNDATMCSISSSTKVVLHHEIWLILSILQILVVVQSFDF